MKFEDYGLEYTELNKQAVMGGFYKFDLVLNSDKGAALTIFFSNDLESTQAKVIDNGATIVKPILSFPGGRRLHFTEPSDNEFAVWSDQELLIVTYWFDLLELLDYLTINLPRYKCCSEQH